MIHARHTHDSPEVPIHLWDEWFAQLVAELSDTDDAWELTEFQGDHVGLAALFMTAQAFAEWHREYQNHRAMLADDDAYRKRIAWGIA